MAVGARLSAHMPGRERPYVGLRAPICLPVGGHIFTLGASFLWETLIGYEGIFCYFVPSKPIDMPFIRFIILLMLLLPMGAPGVAVCADEADSDTLQPYLQALRSDPDNAEALRAMGLHLLHHAAYDEARHYGLRLLSLGERGGEDAGFCTLWGHIVVALADTDTRNATASYAHLEQARVVAERTGDHGALMYIYNGFGNYALFINSDVYTAVSYYFHALDEARTAGDRRQYAILLANLSGAYYLQHDASGLQYAEEAIRIAREDDEPVPLFYGTMHAAHYYLMADSLTTRAREAVDALGRMYGQGGFESRSDLYLLRARLGEREGDTSRAYYNYARAMECFGTATGSTVMAVYLAYARLLRTDGHLDAAIRVLEYGVTGVDTVGNPLHRAQLMKELSLCYRRAKRYDEALRYAYAYEDNLERHFDAVRERATQETRIEHDIYSREQQIDRQRLEILDNRYKIALLSAGLGILFVALGMAWYSYKKKNRLYKAIVTQNREQLQREQALLQQIEALRADTAQPAPAPLSTDKQNDLMSRFTALMVERRLFTDPTLTVGAVAEALGTNRTYLSKAINESTGKTFTQLVNGYRIRQAVAELSDLSSDKPLKQISVDVGFSSLSTFYTLFQSTTGMTPARYRSKLKEV